MANKQGTTPRASLQAVQQQDADWAREMIRRTVQEVLEQEMTELLGAGKSERRSSRSGYRAGYYERTLVRLVGRIELRVPQDREGRFSTSVFERYQQTSRRAYENRRKSVGVSQHLPLSREGRSRLTQFIFQDRDAQRRRRLVSRRTRLSRRRTLDDASCQGGMPPNICDEPLERERFAHLLDERV